MDAVVKAQEALNASAAADTDSEDISGLPEKAESDSSYNSEDLLETEASDSDYLVALPESKGQAEEIIGMLDAEMAAADEESGLSIDVFASYVDIRFNFCCKKKCYLPNQHDGVTDLSLSQGK